MIDLRNLDVEPSDYSDFKELCNAVYRFVASNTDVTYFDLSMEFSPRVYPLFDEVLLALLHNDSLANGSKGYLIGIPPNFEESDSISPQKSKDSRLDNQTDIDNIISDSSLVSRINHIKSIDYNVHNALTECDFYYPENIVADDIWKCVNPQAKLF